METETEYTAKRPKLEDQDPGSGPGSDYANQISDASNTAADTKNDAVLAAAIGDLKAESVSNSPVAEEGPILGYCDPLKMADGYDFTILINDLKEDIKSRVTEISLEEASSIEAQRFDHTHVCISFRDPAEDLVAQLRSVFLSDSQTLNNTGKIHVHFDFGGEKDWNQWPQSFRTSYLLLLSELQKAYGPKVTQCSFLRKYSPRNETLGPDDDASRIIKDIQEESCRWSNLTFLDYSCNTLKLVSGIRFPDTLESLNIAGGQSLTSLQGMHLPSLLKLLDVSQNKISDIDYIMFPKTLQTLSLTENHIYFLENADFPSALENLDISCNRVESLRNVVFPRGLKSLSISGNPIECIKGARFPEGIEYLDASNLPNESMTGIKFPDLTRFLNLQSSMTNTRGLKLPPLVEELNLGCNGVNSINPLKLPNSIRALYLCENNIKTLNKVAFPTAIRELFLGNNMITTLKNVQFPPALELLDLDMDPDTDEHEKYITSLKDVYFPANLRVLRLGYHLIKSIEGIEFPYHLEELSLAYNDLRVFKNVRFGPKIRTLDLSGNQDLLSLDNVVFPESLRELKVPSLAVDNLPPTIVERANRHELVITKSMPYTT
ncbi:L domain-like protein [Metschnikowia bicuspidata var. bicuspidata NRRL YB-4993]|uniref:L domain-like protein n=1 Tax=Metschnikowia bicuspidata var. bicuspidata NRRL YB-4993 TaxID=869754 RepID=A0A1A0H4X9_9ASCO|nr:L domain-like protein [Metschnikowia bicuspidata var. bicuspidata NRRL YB-4993]OBA19134.1 L domain-like protein [Metschnikowia bicuspidata var. bicuspidata NRRL YB-4993]